MKFIPTNVSYVTYVEVNLESHITPEHFKRFFNERRAKAKEITPECTLIKDLLVEDGKYTTTVETFAFPIVSERYCVLTEYNIFDHDGIPGNHLHIVSCYGNEDKTNDEYLGKGFTRSRVLQEIWLGAFHCRRKPDGKLVMVRIVEINSKGIP